MDQAYLFTITQTSFLAMCRRYTGSLEDQQGQA
jgi:hypothetical protein